jgi:predicted nucleic acid-binding protein
MRPGGILFCKRENVFVGAEPLKIYFDTCCYGRHRDSQKNARNAAETVAIMTIIEAARIAGYCILGSMAVISELGRIKDVALRSDIINFYSDTANEVVDLAEEESIRAQVFQAAGIGVTDSVHLAAAEAGGAAYLVTVDADFERIAQNKNLSKVKVINPLAYLAEGIK